MSTRSLNYFELLKDLRPNIIIILFFHYHIVNVLNLLIFQQLTGDLTIHRQQHTKHDHNRVHYRDSSGMNVLTVGKKEFTHNDHQTKFKENWVSTDYFTANIYYTIYSLIILKKTINIINT